MKEMSKDIEKNYEYNIDIIVDNIEEYIYKNNLDKKDFFKKAQNNPNLRLGEGTLAKILSGSYKKDLSITNVLGLCQILECSLDDLLGTKTSSKDNFYTIHNETGLSRKSVRKLNIYKTNKPLRLFDLGKSVEDINEIELINFIVANTDFLEQLKDEVVQYLMEYNLYVKFNREHPNLSKEQKLKSSKSKNELKTSIEHSLGDAVNSVFELFCQKQIKELNLNKK